MSINKSIPHDSGIAHVSGTARYTDDHPLPANAVHLAFGLSQNAHADLTSVDLSAVRAAAGVIAVLTADDLPFENDVSPSIHDEELLSSGSVHYVGQPIFLVVASTHLAARKAARLAKVIYAEKPALITIDDALNVGSTFGNPMEFRNGDPETALKSAPRQISGAIEIGGQEHFYLEGQAAFALPDEGDIIVHSSTQHPTEIQHKVAAALGLPYNAVRVETRRMGGGFGGKESQGNALAVACAVVAHQLQRPAKMRYDRDDDMIITGKRHEFRIKYQAGFDDNGKLTAVVFEHFVRCGWALDLSHPVADRAMLHADNAYYLPNASIVSHRLRTNTQSNTAYRGFGGPQGMMGIERVLDHIAHDLGLDPLKVRKANLYQTGGKQETPYYMEVTDSISAELVDKLAETSDYVARRAEIAQYNANSPVLKRGIALTPVKFGISFTLTHLNQAGALVHVYADGSVHLNHGGTEMGQGLNTKVAQVAAHVFGLSVSAVKITATDTGKVPNTSATAASSGTDLNGMACKAACETIRDRLVEFAAEHWNVAADTISFDTGKVRVGNTVLTFKELAAEAYQSRIQLSATGFYKTPKIQWDRMAGRGRPFLYFSYGAAVSEVVIDTLTGENRILRTDILHDVGRSLNPALDRGQIEGGYVQGAGWLTMEELVWNDKGSLLSHAPSTYKIPSCSDTPEIFNVALWDGDNFEHTIYRSKAVGEPPFPLGISVFMALSDAISSCGKEYVALDAPATSERILRAGDKLRGDAW
ncbi:MAG: xanthine dehydrogenase molybdopterin binding subunit [Rhodobacteraceae bacterium]|nr:xanthine dehydrogenase molybdopterin binding subunit [Paracoccaceae bacterium]